MSASRRAFLGLAATGLATRALGAAGVTADLLAGARGRWAGAADAPLRLKAVAFDAFPVFSSAPVVSRAEGLFPGRGAALTDEWRLRQFEYAWLRLLSGRYADFWHVTQDALVFAARKLKLELDSDARAALMNAFLELVPWSDVVPALDSLAKSGLRLAVLSNFTARMLEANLERSGLSARFDRVLSTDRAKTYKPDPRAYGLGTEALGLRREETLFVAHAGWDAAGAKAFGYPTFWVNRTGLPPEELGAPPDGVGSDLSDLVRFIDQVVAGGGR
jgi:2-haloacid dehalogenase